MALLSVETARQRMLAETTATSIESVKLLAADGRTLAAALRAERTQPPFDVSAMDGYAVRAADITTLPAQLDVIGESAAGHGFHEAIESGQAVRIFTGAPVPEGADAVIIQENTTASGDTVVVNEGEIERGHIRGRGIDFDVGDELVPAGVALTPREITLAAAMGHATLPVRRKPRVALIATGDELVLPGEPVGRDQIVCSNPFGIAHMVARAGGEPVFLGIAADNADDLRRLCEMAGDADLLVTIGGASVGDHDIVAPVLESLGMTLDFWRIAMRPGKPLMFGRLGKTLCVGLPGNPVSSLICTRIFVVPVVRAMLGQQVGEERLETAIATGDMNANGPRQHYMRAVSSLMPDGRRQATPVPSQDSSLLSPLARADVLIVRAPQAPAIKSGDPIQVLPLDF